MNDNHLPNDGLLQLVFGEVDAKRQAAVRKAVAKDAQLAATARGLEAAVTAVRAENAGHLSEQFNDRLRQRMSEVFDHPQPETTRPTFFARSLSKWRWIMRSPVSRVAAAVIFVLAIGGVALWFHSGGTTPAFADFLQPFLDAKTVKYKLTTELTSLPAGMMGIPAEMRKDLMHTTAEVMQLDATRSRQESIMPGRSGKTVQIWDGSLGKTLYLDPVKKRATVYNQVEMPKDETPNDSAVGYAAIFRSALLDIQGKPDVTRESLGEKYIDGRRVVGFRISRPEVVFYVWGDPKTGLPVRIEATVALMPEMKMTMSDFVFNVEMDESLFSVEPPAGYEVKQVRASTADDSPAEEEDLIEMFREYSESSGGRFPDLLDMMWIGQIVTMQMHFADSIEPKPMAKRREEGSEAQAKIRRGVRFAVLLPKEAGSHYAGKGVSVGTADTPVFWYRPKDAEAYRVIYADLSVRDADTPPSVSAVQPEQDLIDMLRHYSELSGGPFPLLLDLQTMTQKIGEESAEEFTIQLLLETFAPENGKLSQEQRHKIEELADKMMDWQKLAPWPEESNQEQMAEEQMTEKQMVEEQILEFADWEKLAPGKGKLNDEQKIEWLEARTKKVTEALMPKYMEVLMPKILESTMKFQPGLAFVDSLPTEADPHYAGKGVSLGAADRPIFWYRPKDAKKYRVIYADLSVREAETPPSVPDAQPVPAPSSAKK